MDQDGNVTGVLGPHKNRLAERVGIAPSAARAARRLEADPLRQTSEAKDGGEGGNRTHPSARSAEATILKTVTTTRHVSLSAPILPCVVR